MERFEIWYFGTIVSTYLLDNLNHEKKWISNYSYYKAHTIDQDH